MGRAPLPRALWPPPAGRGLLALLLAGLGAACASSGGADPRAAREKLARVGLEVLSEAEAAVPAEERGRYVPCRTIPGFPQPALPPHPAGYLIVAPGPEAVLRALAGWRRGGEVRVVVRRNPYLQAEPEWWEAEVELRLP